jgi:hypothetical protein
MLRIGLLIVLAAGCTTPDRATVTALQLTGSYRFAATLASGEQITDSRDDVVFNSPTTVPQCCLGIWRRTESTLELGVGNWLPAPQPVAGRCPAVAQARIYVTGVAAAPQTIELDASNAHIEVHYVEDERAPCPRAADVHDRAAAVETIAASGQIKLATLHCLDAPDDLGCALVASVAWAIDGRGSTVVTTSGTLEANDEVGPVTF